MISFTLVPSKGRHFSKKNSHIAGRGGIRNAPHTVAAERDLHRQARDLYPYPHFSEVAYILDLCFVFPISAAAKKRGIEPMMPVVGRPDTLNLASLVHDALEGVLYEDDSQVVWSSERKVWGERCEIYVTMRSVEELNA